MLNGPDLALLIEMHRRLSNSDLAARLYQSGGSIDRAAKDDFRVTPQSEELAERCEAENFSALLITEENYPPRIRHFLGANAPSVLYCRGNIQFLDSMGISIIGTRRPGRTGKSAAREYAAAFARAAIATVSGNAPGIDAAAHQEALRSGGTTIVFPPSAPDQFVPSFIVDDDPAERMLVLSPFVPGSPTEKWFFLMRNALVAAHSGASLIAETGTRGGTLNTLRHLNRFRRPVFAIRLPEFEKHWRSHELLFARGVRPVSSRCDADDLRQIIEAAREPLASAPEETADFFQKGASK